MRKKIGENKRMKRFRETGSMLKDPSKGSSLRRDLSQGASGLKSAFEKIKDAGKSLSRGTKDLSATRVIQGPKTKQLSSPTAKEAGNKLIQTGQATVKKAKFNQLSPYQQSVQTRNESRANSKRDKLNDSISRAKAKMGPQNTDYKNNYIQSEIDKLKKQLAKIK